MVKYRRNGNRATNEVGDGFYLSAPKGWSQSADLALTRHPNTVVLTGPDGKTIYKKMMPKKTGTAMGFFADTKLIDQLDGANKFNYINAVATRPSLFSDKVINKVSKVLQRKVEKPLTTKSLMALSKNDNGVSLRRFDPLLAAVTQPGIMDARIQKPLVPNAAVPQRPAQPDLDAFNNFKRFTGIPNMGIASPQVGNTMGIRFFTNPRA